MTTITIKDLSPIEYMLRDRQEVLDTIYQWVTDKSAPNSSYAYSRCVVCGCTWWDSREIHNFDCWVPQVQLVCERKVRDASGQ